MVVSTRSITLAQRIHLQQVTRKFLYLARAVDDTILHALNTPRYTRS
jgi:hypothetical protein